MAAAPVGMKRFYAILGSRRRHRHRPPRLSALQAGHGEHSGERHHPGRPTRRDSTGTSRGPTDAPVEITEFADYQCPFCQTFATLQMPTIEERLIKTGRLRWRYRDFPLQQHPFSRIAAHSAACADEQGKFWPQHERIYEGQAEWAAARDAAPASSAATPARSGSTSASTTPACRPASTPAGSRPATTRATRAGRELDADPAGGRPAVSGPASTPTPSPDWWIRSRRRASAK